MLTSEQANAMREAAMMLKSELDQHPVHGVPNSLDTIEKFLEANMDNVLRLQHVPDLDARKTVPWNTLGALTSTVFRNVKDQLNARSKNQQASSEVGDLEEAQRLREIARIMLDIAALLEGSTKKQVQPPGPPLVSTGGLFYPKTHDTPFINQELLGTDENNVVAVPQEVPEVQQAFAEVLQTASESPQAVPPESFVLDNSYYQGSNNQEWQQPKKKILGVGLADGNENFAVNNPVAQANLNPSSNPNPQGQTKEDYYNDLNRVIVKYQNGDAAFPTNDDDTNHKFENMKNILTQLRRMNVDDD